MAASRGPSAPRCWDRWRRGAPSSPPSWCYWGLGGPSGCGGHGELSWHRRPRWGHRGAWLCRGVRVAGGGHRPRALGSCSSRGRVAQGGTAGHRTAAPGTGPACLLLSEPMSPSVGLAWPRVSCVGHGGHCASCMALQHCCRSCMDPCPWLRVLHGSTALPVGPAQSHRPGC